MVVVYWELLVVFWIILGGNDELIWIFFVMGVELVIVVYYCEDEEVDICVEWVLLVDVVVVVFDGCM